MNISPINVLNNILNHNMWDFKDYKMSRAEAITVVNALIHLLYSEPGTLVPDEIKKKYDMLKED